MKFYPLFFLPIILFTSCNPSVRFGKSQKYSLSDNEHEVAISQGIVDHYETIINIDTLNYPLNKYIISNEYKVYIGVSFVNKSAEITNFYRNNETYTIHDANYEKSSASMFFEKESLYCYSFIYDSEVDKLTYFLTIEADSAVSYNKFREDLLKIKVKND